MFETIIVGIDGRPQDAEALALAQQLADPGAEIIAVKVASTDTHAVRDVDRKAEALRRDGAENDVDAFTGGLTGIEGLVVGADSVGRGLRDAAAGASADLIVVASSRRGLIGRIAAGNAVKDVLDRAPCAVAVATVGHRRQGPIKRVTIGYDGSAAAEQALIEAVRIGRRDDASMAVVDVVEPALAVAGMGGAYVGDALDDEYARARSNLDRLQHEFGLHGVIATGRAGQQLAAASRGADLLAIGLHHHDWLERILAGSAGSSVLGDHSAALLIVPTQVADALDTIVPS